MANGIPDIQSIGQKALGLPAELASVGSRRMTEDLNMLNAKVAELSTALIPSPTGLALPQLPGLPGIGTAQAPAPVQAPVQAPTQAQMATRSQVVQGIKTKKKTSYMEV
jgi:hypothetical protein